VTGDLKRRKSSGSYEPPPLERRENLRKETSLNPSLIRREILTLKLPLLF